MRILSIGEILWDVIGGKEYLGGAPFNFSVHAVRLGHEVKFLSAVGRDDRGNAAFREAVRLGVDTEFLTHTSEAETGVSYVSNEATQGKHRLPRPAAYDFVSLNGTQRGAIEAWKPDWLYFGTLLQMDNAARRLTKGLAEITPQAKHFYDVNLRPNNYSDDIVREMLRIATIIKLNEEEAPELARITGLQTAVISEEFCVDLALRYTLETVCVTKGPHGSAVYRRNPAAWVETPGYQVRVADTVGAGDAFSAGLVHGISEGWPIERVCDFANRVGALVASRSGATPPWTIAEALAL